jgi:23S rRNA pseudouridine1911/1915/1917 synthase
LCILFEDAHCLAIAKPPGQFTQGEWAPAGESTLESAVRAYLAPDDPGAAYVGMVHRLDRPTSGVLLWGKSAKAARRLSAQFEARRVVKEYWAIVEITGQPASNALAGSDPRSERQEVWTDWLTRPDQSGLVAVVAPNSAGAREAITRVERMAQPGLRPEWQWLRMWPATGRTHQLRAQATRRGTPIVGDTSYGAARFAALEPGIALHARRLVVRHPILNTTITLTAPVPDSWCAAGMILDDPDNGRA